SGSQGLPGAPAAPDTAAQAPPGASDTGRWLALCQVLQREVSPWFTFPAYRTRLRQVVPPQSQPSQSQRGPASTFEAIDSVLQGFVRRWIDPLFGDTGNRQLQELGITLNMDAVSPVEQSINRFLVISVVALGLTLAGTWLYPPLLVLGVVG